MGEGRSTLSRGQWALLVFAAVSASLLFVLVTGIGPDLPGPRLRETLGLADPVRYEPCKLDRGEERTPASPRPARGRWRTEAPLPLPRDELGATALGGDVYLTNGHELGDDGMILSTGIVQRFDPRSGKYDRLPETPIPLDHAVAAAYRDRLFIAGGYSEGVPSDRLFSYSPAERRWDELAPMDVSRASPAGAVTGGRLYVAGGIPKDAETEEPVNSVEAYDFETGSWSEVPAMPTPRHHHAATTLDGRLYVAGGRNPESFSLDAFERFDPRTEAWEELPGIPTGVGGPAAVAHGGEVIVIGGGDDEEADGLQPWVTGAVWAFEPERQGWRRLPDLRVPRHGFSATVLGDRIYAFGGAPCSGYGRTEVTESLSTAVITGPVKRR